MVDDGAEECRKGTRLALIIRRGIRVPTPSSPFLHGSATSTAAFVYVKG
jgi:hypothetical protein